VTYVIACQNSFFVLPFYSFEVSFRANFRFSTALRCARLARVEFCSATTHDGDLRFLHHLFTISEEARRTTTMKMMMMGLRGLAASALLLSVTEGAYRNEIKVC
jgi:hypothetical protein